MWYEHGCVVIRFFFVNCKIMETYCYRFSIKFVWLTKLCKLLYPCIIHVCITALNDSLSVFLEQFLQKHILKILLECSMPFLFYICCQSIVIQGSKGEKSFLPNLKLDPRYLQQAFPECYYNICVWVSLPIFNNMCKCF